MTFDEVELAAALLIRWRRLHQLRKTIATAKLLDDFIPPCTMRGFLLRCFRFLRRT